VLVPLRCAGTKVPDVDVSVFARFKNVQLEGYCDTLGTYQTADLTGFGIMEE